MIGAFEQVNSYMPIKLRDRANGRNVQHQFAIDPDLDTIVTLGKQDRILHGVRDDVALSVGNLEPDVRRTVWRRTSPFVVSTRFACNPDSSEGNVSSVPLRSSVWGEMDDLVVVLRHRCGRWMRARMQVLTMQTVPKHAKLVM